MSVDDRGRPHDPEREFAAWERLCTALYDACQATFDLALNGEHECDRNEAAKIGMHLKKMFERQWQTYGYRRQQKDGKR